MAHFYGTLQGSRGGATRCGTKSSGITTNTASWAGAVCVTAYYDEDTKVDMVTVSLRPWHGRGVNRTLYDGPISGNPLEIPEEPTQDALGQDEADGAACRAMSNALRAAGR